MKRVAGDIFGSVGSPELRRNLKTGLVLREVWEDALGGPLARVLEPGVLRADGELQILVESSSWLMEARFLEPRILSALRKAAPALDLRSVKLELAPKKVERPEPGRVRPKAPPRRTLGEDEEARIHGLVDSVRDDALRERLERFLRKAASLGPPHEEEDVGLRPTLAAPAKCGAEDTPPSGERDGSDDD